MATFIARTDGKSPQVRHFAKHISLNADNTSNEPWIMVDHKAPVSRDEITAVLSDIFHENGGKEPAYGRKRLEDTFKRILRYSGRSGFIASGKATDDETSAARKLAEKLWTSDSISVPMACICLSAKNVEDAIATDVIAAMGADTAFSGYTMGQLKLALRATLEARGVDGLAGWSAGLDDETAGKVRETAKETAKSLIPSLYGDEVPTEAESTETAAEAAEATPDYSEMAVAELRKLCNDAGIEYRKRANAVELGALLAAAKS